jgi:hypothetical protein
MELPSEPVTWIDAVDVSFALQAGLRRLSERVIHDFDLVISLEAANSKSRW